MKNKIKQLENKQKEILTSFSEEELEQYIQVLARNYYINYLNNDLAGFNNVANQLKEVIQIFNYDFPKLNIFINFCLLDSINKILESNLENNIELVPIHEITISDVTSLSGIEELARAYENGKEFFRQLTEAKKHIEELERKLAKYEGVNSDGSKY